MKMIRQGDVLLFPVSEIPAEQTPKVSGKVILAYGEVTGHHHRFENENVRGFWKEGDDNKMAGGSTIDNLPAAFVGTPSQIEFVEIPEGGADLVHEEHSAIHVEPGAYRVVRQVEYVAPNIVRQVYD